MPSTQTTGGGDDAGALGVPLGVADGDPPGVPPAVPDGLPLGAGPVLAAPLVPGRAEGLADAVLVPCVACGLTARDVAAGLVPAVPPAAREAPEARDALGDGTMPRAGTPADDDPAGVRFAAGASCSAPETSSPTRPAPASRAAPTASVPARRRWYHGG